MLKEVAEHHPVVLFTKENTDTNKLVPVINLPPVMFIGGPSKQVITGSIHGAWDPDRLVAVITAVGVPVE